MAAERGGWMWDPDVYFETQPKELQVGGKVWGNPTFSKVKSFCDSEPQVLYLDIQVMIFIFERRNPLGFDIISSTSIQGLPSCRVKGFTNLINGLPKSPLKCQPEQEI